MVNNGTYEKHKADLKEYMQTEKYKKSKKQYDMDNKESKREYMKEYMRKKRQEQKEQQNQINKDNNKLLIY
jgi:hypothetical protein